MIPAVEPHLAVAAWTHPGMRGKNNEDRYAFAAYQLENTAATPVVLAVLCDGIGGHRAGEVAAQLAVDAIQQQVALSNAKNPPETLRIAIQTASQIIQQQAKTRPEYHGMGATCVCAWVIGDQLYAASVGDSRLYLLRDGIAIQLTTDHTWIQEAIENGVLRPDQAAGHPNAHVIRRYLGSPNPPEVDFRLRLGWGESDAQAAGNQGLRLRTGDALMLCSDGLSDLVSAEELAALVNGHVLEEAGPALVNLANQRGGHDNITLVLARVPQGVAREPEPASQPATPRREWGCALAVLALALLLAVALAFSGLWAWYTGKLARRTPTPTTVLISATPTFDLPPTSTPFPSATPGQAVPEVLP